PRARRPSRAPSAPPSPRSTAPSAATCSSRSRSWSGGVEELLEAVAGVGAERDLLEHADALLVAARRAHHLLQVLVLERHGLQLVDLPRLASVRELALPHAVTPLGVHVADALHPEADERLEVDVLATAVGVHQRDARVPGATRAGQVVDVVLATRE